MAVGETRKLTVRKLVAWAAALAVLVLAEPGSTVLVIGVVLASTGLAVRLWATGYLRKNERLTREGPYRHLRHPLYLGTWLIATGFLVAGLGPGAPHVLLLALLGGFQVAFFTYYLPRKEAKECDRLLRGHGAEFAAFRAAVPAFGPRLVPVPAPPDPVPWSARQVGANSEWGVLAGTAAGFLFLALRSWGLLP